MRARPRVRRARRRPNAPSVSSSIPISLAIVLLAFASCATPPEGAQPATPQRPTLSSDTNTAAEDTFEVEFGATVDPGDAFASPTTLRYGAGARTELFVGFSPYNLIDATPQDAEGFGDTVLGVRRRFWESEGTTSAAFQLSAKLPTASESEGLGTGEVDAAAAAILSHGFGERAGGTLYYELGFLGRPSSSGHDYAHALAATGSYGLTEKTVAFAELSQVLRPGDRDPLVTNLGAAYAVNPSFLLDVSIDVGLNDDAPDLLFLVGLTANLGTLGG